MSQKWEGKPSLFLCLRCLECVVLLCLCCLSSERFGSMFSWSKYWCSLQRETEITPVSVLGIWVGTGWRMDGELVEADPNGSKKSF